VIPYGKQHITEEDIEAVVRVLRSEWLTQGPAVPAFEQLIQQYCGAEHAVAANSATSALHIACVALDLGPGDWLWTAPNTFVASANCARFCGASVDFVDIDPRTYNMSIEALERKLIGAQQADKLPKIVIPVHFGGQSCDTGAIADLATRYGFRVIEDASHAIGARWNGECVGACTNSDVVVFSFHPVKIITTGEGGIALTSSPDLARRMRRLRTHGISRDSGDLQFKNEGPWYYEQLELGFNYRMSDIQAALGISQLNRLDTYIARRRELARRYDELLEGLPVIVPWQDPRSESAWHLYVIQLPAQGSKLMRRAFVEAVRRAGVGVNVHYIPVHLQPYYRSQGFGPGDFPQAERYYERAVTLPLFYSLADSEQQRVVAAVRSALHEMEVAVR
jgi:UDP-4-amino-4,6-dideoxy-N-acetyl-beta-L-altrosamine transaminase